MKFGRIWFTTHSVKNSLKSKVRPSIAENQARDQQLVEIFETSGL